MINNTDYDFIKSRLSPCGLHCGKCFAFAEGDIALLSKRSVDINLRMKEIGVEAYYSEIKDKPRY